MINKLFHDWEHLYRNERPESMPWYLSKLDADLEQTLNALGIRGGKILDLGTGPGTQAIQLARRGFKVTATDISQSAVCKAADQAKKQGVQVLFRQDDILKSRLHDFFPYVFDRGVFHVFTPEQRQIYVEALHKLVWTGGYLFLKCFATKPSHPSPLPLKSGGEGKSFSLSLGRGQGEGPYGFQLHDIETIFGKRFKIKTIKETVFDGTLKFKPKALFCILQCRK